MRDHVYPLDVLRFFAALCVAVYHLGFYGWASRYGTTSVILNNVADYEALAPYTWFGWVGVEIFFVISGFVIANSAYGRSPTAFLKGRLIRLLPAAWVCASITLVAWLLLAHVPMQDLAVRYLRSLTLWLDGPWIDGVYWSLAIEIVFYALVFWSLTASRFISMPTIAWALTALPVIHFALLRTGAGDDNALIAWILANADVLLMRYGGFFAAGIWLWLMSQRQMTPLRYGALAVTVLCGYGEIANRVNAMSSGELDIAMALPVIAPILVWTAAVLFVFVAARRPDLFKVRAPRLQAVFKRIGLMTYPMFLVHNVVGAGIIRMLATNGVNEWVALALAFAAVLAVAFAVSAFAEPSIRKHMSRAFDWTDVRVRALFAQRSPAA